MPSTITDRTSGLGTGATANGENATISQKVPCRVATTANITLAGLQTLDTVTVVADDRVLVKDQTDASENGIYLASADAWQRTSDCADAGDLLKGTQVRVNEGAAAYGLWHCSADDPIVIGTDNIGWVPATSARWSLDATAYFDLTGTNVFLAADSDDYMSYDRAGNVWAWFVGGAGVLSLSASGLTVTGGITAGEGTELPLLAKGRTSDNLAVRILESSNGAAGLQFTDDPVTTEYGSLSADANTFRISKGGANPIFFRVNSIDYVALRSNGNFEAIGGRPLGYGTGSGGTVTQITNRTTGVTLNKPTGQITLVSAAGTGTWQFFTVTNSVVKAEDVVAINAAQGVDNCLVQCVRVADGSFDVGFASFGTTVEQPVFNFAVIKGATS